MLLFIDFGNVKYFCIYLNHCTVLINTIAIFLNLINIFYDVSSS